MIEFTTADVVLVVLFLALVVGFLVLGFQFVVDRWVDTFKAGRDVWKNDK